MEVVNRTLGSTICCIAGSKPKLWDFALTQAEFAFDSMLNRCAGQPSFAIAYTKLPNSTVDLVELPKPKSRTTAELAQHIFQSHQDMKSVLEQSNACYKSDVDCHHCVNVFNVRDLVMIQISEKCYPVGSYHKLQPKELGPFRVLKRLGDNAYLIDLPSLMKISNVFNVKDISPFYPTDDSPLSLEDFGLSTFIGEEK